MSRSSAALGAALACLSAGAQAHGVAGPRLFPVTLTLDDPSVADEASLPTIVWNRIGANGGPGPADQYFFQGEYDKRITERFGLAINFGYNVTATQHDKTRTGFEDVVLTAKYLALVDPEHEALVSLGVIREFGRTGTAHLGADQYGFTQPTVYAGKGFGDIPVDWLRPFAVTGEFGFAVADKQRKLALDGTPANNGYENRWTGGLSLQYSIPYLQSQVRDLGWPAPLDGLFPIVEATWSSPANAPSALGTQYQVAPGAIYVGRSYQVGVEALVPGNRATGTHVGVIAQFHVYFDDLLPNSLGRPILE